MDSLQELQWIPCRNYIGFIEGITVDSLQELHWIPCRNYIGFLAGIPVDSLQELHWIPCMNYSGVLTGITLESLQELQSIPYRNFVDGNKLFLYSYDPLSLTFNARKRFYFIKCQWLGQQITNTKFILHLRYKMEEFKQIEHIYEQFAQQVYII